MKQRTILVAMMVGLMALSTLLAEGRTRTYHNTARNNFGGLYPAPGMRMAGRYKAIEENLLIEENATMATAITLDTMNIASRSYNYVLRIANLNNKQGKTQSIKNPMTGSKTTLTSTSWGLVFNYDEQGNYYAVVLECDNSSPYDDITDKRTMKVMLVEQTAEQSRVLEQTTLDRGVSLEDGMNTLSVDVDEHGVEVAIGKVDMLEVVLETSSLRRSDRAVAVGYLVGPGARVAIERAALTINNDNQVAELQTDWTLEALDEYFAQSADPVEGYWQYLDRDMDDEWLRLGGRYSLATVRADYGYDIIYLDGARVNKSLWQPGMIKGHLTKTIFTGNYDLFWIDATMEPIDDEAYATLENGVILTFYFPTYKSQTRFAKVIDIE